MFTEYRITKLGFSGGKCTENEIKFGPCSVEYWKFLAEAVMIPLST